MDLQGRLALEEQRLQAEREAREKAEKEQQEKKGERQRGMVSAKTRWEGLAPVGYDPSSTSSSQQQQQGRRQGRARREPQSPRASVASWAFSASARVRTRQRGRRSCARALAVGPSPCCLKQRPCVPEPPLPTDLLGSCRGHQRGRQAGLLRLRSQAQAAAGGNVRPGKGYGTLPIFAGTLNIPPLFFVSCSAYRAHEVEQGKESLVALRKKTTLMPEMASGSSSPPVGRPAFLVAP